jgi:hypothetical protein
MAGYIHAQPSELLYRSPHRRSADAQFLGDLRSTRNHGGVIHQEQNDLAQTRVREGGIAAGSAGFEFALDAEL